MSYIPHTTRLTYASLTYASLKFPAPENLSPRTRAVIRHRYDNVRADISAIVDLIAEPGPGGDPDNKLPALRTLCAEATDLQRLLGIYVPSKHNA